MPCIITVCPVYSPAVGALDVKRTAVATPEEAEEFIFDRFEVRVHVEEEGVTDIGPLGNGTVIEVRYHTPMAFRALAGVPAVWLDDEALAAFNAQQ